MYRTPATSETSAPPAEFVYEGRKQHRAPAQLLMQVFLMPLFIGGIGAAFAGPAGGIAATLGSAAALYFFAGSSVERKALRVVDGDLVLNEGKSKKPALRMALADLDDVELDTKTVQHAVEGDSAIPAMRLVDMKPGLEVDVTRIALVTSQGRRIYLSEDRLAHTETTEAFGKLRVFLRKHGWLPASEREAAPSSRS